LHSALEVAKLRINESVEVFHPYLTRTAAVYFKEKGEWYVAFDDTADPDKNVILADRLGNIPKNNTLVKDLLKRAYDLDRIVKVENTEFFPISEFGDNSTLKAIIGKYAQPYARLLRRNDEENGFIELLSPERLENICRGDKFRVIYVAVGGVCCETFFVDCYIKATWNARGIYEPVEYEA